MKKIEIAEKKKISRVLFNNARAFIGAFIIFAVIVVMTTDITLISSEEISSLGLDFFLLLICTYSFYSLCADSGMKAGLSSNTYKGAVERFGSLKKTLLDSLKYTRMNEFCAYYVEEDLKQTRLQYLSVASLSYDVYLQKYSKLTKREVLDRVELSDVQQYAVIKANKIKPVKLTPKMIMTQGRSAHSRSPLPISPGVKRAFIFGATFTKIATFSVCLSAISFEIITNPSWVIFASVCIKLVSIVINGFGGYKDGNANITVDTVDYLECQSDLMEQAIHFIDADKKLNSKEL